MRAIFTTDVVITDGVWVDARSYGDDMTDVTIQAALDDIGSDEKTLLIAPGNWSIDPSASSITIGTNINLKVVCGGVLHVASGKTLVVNGGVEAGSYQIFDTSAGGSVTGLNYANVLWFDSDPYTNGFNAINKAVRSVIGATSSYGHGHVYIPGGDYTIGTTGVFSDTNAIGMRGLKVTGDGWANTRLVLTPSTSDIWFYNNVSTQRLQFPVFSDIAFIGLSDWSTAEYADISEYAKGFRLYSTASTSNFEQGFRFEHCWFSCLNTVLSTDGDQTTSENKFIDCKISKISNVVFDIDNIQCVDIELYGSDLDVIYGDVFRIGPDGGGNFKVYGGSWIIMSDSGSDEFVIDIPAAASTGATNMPIIFNGVRFELRGNNTKLVNADFSSGLLEAVFNNCLFLSSATAIKTGWVTIANSKRVIFNACMWTWTDTLFYETYNLSSASQYGEAGFIKWNDCHVDQDLSSRITFASNFGFASARGNNGNGVGSITSDPKVYAQDFDLFGIAAVGTDFIGSQQNSNFLLKSISIMHSPYHPYNNSNEKTVILPKHASIKSIRIMKPASGASTSDYCLHVGNNDKSTVYASSIPEHEKYTHRINYDRGSQTCAQLTVRTDDNTGVFTLIGDNRSISEGDTVNINWVVSGAAGRRFGMTITSISMATNGYIDISLDGGSGDNLPVVNSDVILTSVMGFINVGEIENSRIVRYWSSNGDKVTAAGSGIQTGGYGIIEYY